MNLYQVPVEKNIAVFSHNYLVNDWLSILDEQFIKLLTSGLYDKAIKLYYCVYSESYKDFNDFIEKISLYDYLNKVEIVKHEKNDREYHTLMFIKQFSNKINEDVDIIFILKA